MNKMYYYHERENQIKYYYHHLEDTAENYGIFRGKPREFVLKNGIFNLFGGIQENCKLYFEQEGITWWGENKSMHLPSGHLVSSQINCLNHLFALRTDDSAVRMMMEKVTGIQIKKVLPSPIDKDEGYITFEFARKNKELLGEKNETRGAKCTSVDALVYVLTMEKKKVLIPVEWKYTETYQGTEAKQESLDRYPKRILPDSNLNGWTNLYKADPYYELIRQTLLIEQIIHNKETSGIEADDYFHIMVVPNDHAELKNAIEEKYIPTLQNKSKFRIIDPQSLLSPLESNAKYKDLITYLQTRYW